MLKIMKMLKALMAKGFATAEEKKVVVALYKELETEEAEAVKEEVAKVEDLPTADPASEEGEMEKNLKTIIEASVKSISKKELEKGLDAIKAEVKSYLEKEKEAMKNEAGAYNKSAVEKRHGMGMYMRKFISALLNQDTAEMAKLNGKTTVKELTTDSTGSPFGGYVVTSELSAEIRALITEYGVARQEFNNVQLSKNSYKANELATDVTVAWATEGSDIGSTQIVIGQENLELAKLTAIVTATRELLEDSEIDLFGFIATRVAEGFAKKEDTAFFVGTGVSDTTNGGFLGLINNTDVNLVDMASGKDAFADVTANDLLAMQDGSPQWVAKNGKYYMHRSIRNLIRGLKTTDGLYVYQAPTDNAPATIWGRPVVEVEVMPTTADTDAGTPFIIYADLKKASILGYKGSMAMDRFNAGTVKNVAGNGDINLITSDREAIRWVERVGAVTILPKAVTVLYTATS